MNYQRLLFLADCTETRVPEKQFDMTMWVNRSTWKGAADFSCGTSACIMGWATTFPEFRKLGLHMSKEGIVSFLGHFASGFQAAAALFDISLDQAKELFAVGWNGVSRVDETSKQAAARIRHFVYKTFYMNRPANWLLRRPRG
jgi:hypothetical protein